MDPEKLLVKISLGKKLSEKELDDLRDALERIELKHLGKAGLMDQAYALVHLISKAGLKQFAYLIEPYLEAKDSLLVALVLETLCLQWKEREGYIERVIDFALGSGWDEDEDVRETALKILGEYLRETLPASGGRPAEKPRRVLELLLSTVQDSEVSDACRQSAYSALSRAAGKEWEELPSEYAALDFGPESKDLDQPMLHKLSETLG